MITLDTKLRAARMLEAGRVTATFRSPSGSHITLTAKCRAPNDAGKWKGCPLAEAKIISIEVPPADGGFGDKVGKVTQARGFVADPRADEARAFCARHLLRWLAGEELPAGLEVFEENRCGKCGRALTDPVSIERGIGPECYGASTGSQHQVKDPQPGKTRGTGIGGGLTPAERAARKAPTHETLDAALALAANGAAMGDAASTGEALRVAEELEREPDMMYTEDFPPPDHVVFGQGVSGERGHVESVGNDHIVLRTSRSNGKERLIIPEASIIYFRYTPKA